MFKKSVMFFLICVILAVTSTNEVSAASDEPVIRLDGKDRFEVAVNVSNEGWRQRISGQKVFLTYYNAFADALSAAPLAYKYNAPILLTHTDNLTEVTKQEILRLRPDEVIIVGGPGSVSDQVLKQVKSIAPKVTRIGGANRFDVAKNIAKKFGNYDQAFIANGLIYPDALAITPIAAKRGVPILLTRPDVVPRETMDSLKNVKGSIVVGGPGSVSNQILGKLKASMRIGGSDRFEVATNIIEKLNVNHDRVFVATGFSFADALTGSVLAAKENAPLLLTRPNDLPNSSILKDVSEFRVLGGYASVSEAVVSGLAFERKTNDPVVYFVPHADDELLSYSVNIRNEMDNGRPVYLILLSKGEDSGARDIENGYYDSEYANPEMDGTPIYCWWHQTYHDPMREGYLHEHITVEEFGKLREDDFFRSGLAMGISMSHLISDPLPVADLTVENVKEKLQKYIAQYPNADFRTMSKYDAHDQHAVIGQALEQLEIENKINPYRTAYFVSIYTDRYSGKKVPETRTRVHLNNPTDIEYLEQAILEYKKFDPSSGLYGNGYHSVAKQFDAFKQDMVSDFHY